METLCEQGGQLRAFPRHREDPAQGAHFPGRANRAFLAFSLFKFIYHVVHPSPSGGDERLGDPHLFLTQSRGLEEFSREAKRTGDVLKPGIWGGLAKANPSC